MLLMKRMPAQAALSLLLCTLTLDAAEIRLRPEPKRKHAPEFELKDAEGKSIRLSDYKGKVVLLDFWATWCTPCRDAIPWYNEFSKKYREAGLTVIGLSMDETGWDVVKPFADQNKIQYPIVVATKRTAYLYGDVRSLPLVFFVDRNQRVAAIHVGTAKRTAVEKTIERLLLEH